MRRSKQGLRSMTGGAWSKAIAGVLCAMALSFVAAKAKTFDVSGTYSGTLFGALNIDVSTGTVTSADIIEKDGGG
jgi:uncharacterized membrane protein